MRPDTPQLSVNYSTVRVYVHFKGNCFLLVGSLLRFHSVLCIYIDSALKILKIEISFNHGYPHRV